MKSIENAWETLADDLQDAITALQNGAKKEDVTHRVQEAYSRLNRAAIAAISAYEREGVR